MCMAVVTKRKWISPEVRRFGTFEAATQGCDKHFGDYDGFTFMGNNIVCSAS